MLSPATSRRLADSARALSVADDDLVGLDVGNGRPPVDGDYQLHADAYLDALERHRSTVAEALAERAGAPPRPPEVPAR